MSAPRIAIPGMWANSVSGLRFSGNTVATAVLSSVVRAGGEPVVLFEQSNLTPQERLVGFDGVLVPGGNDIQPSLYGQPTGPETKVAESTGQDEFERSILRAAIELRLPVLAICRGFQMFNVMHGGSLIQDLPARHEIHRNDHHDVDVVSDSRLASVLGGVEQIRVSSYHHQAVERLGFGLRAVATAEDGIVEAIEPVDPAIPVVAVQWHPEDTAATESQQQGLFDWLIETAAVPASEARV